MFLSRSILLGALFPQTFGYILHRRALDDPGVDYLFEMCTPLETQRFSEMAIADVIPSLHDSPFPCEQEAYILNSCIASASSEIDFLAEQQCLCGSNFWSAYNGCSNCYLAHGYTSFTDAEVSSWVSSVSTAECSAKPTQPFTRFFTTADFTSQRNSPTITLVNDRFPNNTAVSNYWTGLPSASLGSITGSATGRATVYSYSDEDSETSSLSRLTSLSAKSGFNQAITSTSSTTSAPSITSAPSTPATASSQASSSTSTRASQNAGGKVDGLLWGNGIVLVLVTVVTLVV